ncbi:hypothetical protein [Helicobacter cetorum]|uniref:hypothetical protein n=1 Tax=Helicobacter cetorum TaxID=138563 RepID=UPI000CF0801A|nr:hypothetical protein [Helicobacter cetorum]
MRQRNETKHNQSAKDTLIDELTIKSQLKGVLKQTQIKAIDSQGIKSAFNFQKPLTHNHAYKVNLTSALNKIKESFKANPPKIQSHRYTPLKPSKHNLETLKKLLGLKAYKQALQKSQNPNNKGGVQ